MTIYGTAGSMSFMFVLVLCPLSPVGVMWSSPDKCWFISQSGDPDLRKVPFAQGAAGKPDQLSFERRHRLYYPSQETNLPSILEEGTNLAINVLEKIFLYKDYHKA